MMKCVEEGHSIVALANATPPATLKKEEMDSYLFQTVGQTFVPYIAECMGLPLYQQEIQGSAIYQELEYNETSGDETEDLYKLIKRVLVDHPDISGVSVGAILSSYQANRVSHVCKRLGLEMHAYLWQREQKELFEEMLSSDLEAVIIKVAGIGLKQSDLMKSLGEMRTKLFSLNEKYGSHICGEGGEYETFTLNCPLFKKKIRVTDWSSVVHSDDIFDPVCFAKIEKVILEDK
ncbi:hypothetical protein BB560_003968 [Smittium megazygosporum]|uniref:Diphthine--ammonia ligase n=1 Tax=Smittium megazygosporum TaxID=133381 RepID=A0A2T9ZAN6_9FUNG|nr:hypothetical protein BB560_003968 [Smittium megazygosporum]